MLELTSSPISSERGEVALLRELSRITNRAADFALGLERVRHLFSQSAGLLSISVELPEQSRSDAGDPIESLLAPADHPYRFLYSVGLKDGGLEIGRLELAFAFDVFPGDAPRRIAAFAGEQLGLLLGRTRLRAKRLEAERELAELQQQLSAWKLLARAQGILTARHRMKANDARKWIEGQGHRHGVRPEEIAELLIARSIPTERSPRPGLPAGRRLTACGGDSDALGQLPGRPANRRLTA